MTPALYDYITDYATGYSGRVLEFGSRPADGQHALAIKPLFLSHIGVDIEPGDCVDIVRDVTLPNTTLPEIETADTVLCLETLEHMPRFWRFLERLWSMRPGATLILSFPWFEFPYHPHPVDCYRFSEDAVPALTEGFVIDEVRKLSDGHGHYTVVVKATKD